MDVSGYVYYSPDSCALDIESDMETTASGTYTNPITLHAQKPIAGVTIVLVTDEGGTPEYACAKTNSQGFYLFTNVPSNNNDQEGHYYKVIEAFGYQPATTEYNVDFITKKKLLTEEIIPADPTVEYILGQGFEMYNGNRIVSLYPNTIPIYTFNDEIFDRAAQPYISVTLLNFKDAPQRCEPLVLSDFLQFQNATVKGGNIVTAADNGTFGSAPAGTRHSTQYSGVDAYDDDSNRISDYVCAPYTATSPQDNQYAITNIASATTFNTSWFDTADHTKGDETGRLMIVNGGSTGSRFFRTSINIESNTAYLFSCWVMNLMRFPEAMLPEFSINILDTGTGQLLFNETFNREKPMKVTEIPTWRQIGTILSEEILEGKSNITIEFISEGVGGVGNDYAVDDVIVVGLKRGVIAFKNVVSPEDSIELGGEIDYECIIKNSIDNDNIMHVMFKDLIQEGVSIKEDSFTLTCSDIIDKPFEIKRIAKRDSSIDDVGIDVGKIIASLVEETDPNYIALKLEKIPPGVDVIIRFKVQVNSVNKTSPYNNIKNRFRLMFLSESDSEDTERSRSVASNEVMTTVIYPELKAEKSMSKITNNIKMEIERGGTVFSGTEVFYSIKIINSGKAAENSMTIKDEFNDKFIYSFPDDLSDCHIRITKQIVSPEDAKQDEEQVVPCSDILSYGSHGLQINNISVPAAEEDGDNIEEGICIVRIYGKIKS